MPRKKKIKESQTDSLNKLQQDIHNSKDPDVLLGDRRKPRGWSSLTYEQKLDYIASRIIAEDRHGVTSHKELKETGILSVSQYERRRKREVYSQLGDLDTIKVKEGQFSRAHVRDLRGLSEDIERPAQKVKVTRKKVTASKNLKKKTTKKKVEKNGRK